MSLGRLKRRRPMLLLFSLLLLMVIFYLHDVFTRSAEDRYSYENSLARGYRFDQPYHGAPVTKNLTARFQERRRRVLEVCSRDNISARLETRAAANRFVFPTTSLPTVLYCPVPRTGTMYLRKLIAAVNGITDPITWKARFHVRDVVDGYDNAIMFMVAREPFSRLLSAYVSRLWAPSQEFWSAVGGQIVATVRSDPTLAELACGHDVTFPELIRYVIRNVEKDSPIHGSLAPAYKLCEVCRYDYDYIGHMETFSEDLANILAAVNMPLPPDFEGLGGDDEDIISDYTFNAFVTLMGDQERCLNKHLLILRVWRALQVTGIISMNLTFPLSWRDSLDIKRFQLRQLLMENRNRSLDIFNLQDQQRAQQHDHTQSQTSPSSGARLMQRRRALASAWSQVPMEDRHRIRELFGKEFKLFGYDPFLQDVFDPKVDVDPQIFDVLTV